MRLLPPAIALVVCVCTAPAGAETIRNFNIPSQRLDSALIALGGQAQISIGSVDTRLSVAQSRAVHGRMTVSSALKRMLRGTGFDYVRIDSATVRIVPAAPPRLVSRSKRPKPVVAVKPERPRVSAPVSFPPPDPPDIVVTGSKQLQPLESYAGTAHILSVGELGLDPHEGTTALVDRLPGLSGTNLGPGRNKLFIRGVSDSSFTGPTQATVGLYLGDLRLTYNAPDPDLRFYDVERIEVIEGPQGTLYGAGSLGGIVRIIPRQPTADAFHASGSGGIATIKGGSIGHDIAGMINIPLWRDKLAVRVLGYRQIEGGYIDDPGLGLTDVNRARISGWRGGLRLTPGDGWSLDLGALEQAINTRDTQYSERGLGRLKRAARVRQPFDNNIRAAHVTLSKAWDRVNLVSVTSAVEHDLGVFFDATDLLDPDNVQLYEEDEELRMINHETRLSGKMGGGGSWVAGINYVRNKDTVIRMQGAPGEVEEFARLKNETLERAVFGEATRAIGGNLSATLGARLVRVTTSGELINVTNPEAEPSRRQTRFLPTAALTWKPAGHWLIFARFRSGFRGGGLGITGSDSDAVQRFVPDNIRTFELGARHGDRDDRLSGNVTASHTIWHNIQADLLRPDGLVFTNNIGRGRIWGFEANARWKPLSGVIVDTGLFLNDSELVTPASAIGPARMGGLPNIAAFGARSNISFTWPASAPVRYVVAANLRYVGRSRLGAVPPLIFKQGNYADFGLSGALIGDKWRLTAEVTNLLDVAGNSFSYGNPFTVDQGQQITPIRPRAIRLGVSFGF